MGMLSKIFKKKEVMREEPIRTELPEELERFKPGHELSLRDREFHTFAKRLGESATPSPEFPPVGTSATVEEAFSKEKIPKEKSSEPVDKLDLVISKLETIDERLKVIEERLRRGI